MNTSVQIKTHSTTSAKNKNTHILRNSEAYKNPNILVIQKNDIAFKKERILRPRAVYDNINGGICFAARRKAPMARRTAETTEKRENEHSDIWHIQELRYQKGAEMVFRARHPRAVY